MQLKCVPKFLSVLAEKKSEYSRSSKKYSFFLFLFVRELSFTVYDQCTLSKLLLALPVMPSQPALTLFSGYRDEANVKMQLVFSWQVLI